MVAAQKERRGYLNNALPSKPRWFTFLFSCSRVTFGSSASGHTITATYNSSQPSHSPDIENTRTSDPASVLFQLRSERQSSATCCNWLVRTYHSQRLSPDRLSEQVNLGTFCSAYNLWSHADLAFMNDPDLKELSGRAV